jgi:hypothetical protein
MAAFEENMLRGAFNNLHMSVIMHPFMHWMSILPEHTVKLMMSIIEACIWDQQRPIIGKIIYCGCFETPFFLEEGYCREIVEGA